MTRHGPAYPVTSSRHARRTAVTVLAVLVLLLGGLGFGYALEADGSLSDPSAAATTPSGSSTSPPATVQGVTPARGGGGTLNNEVVVFNFTDGRFADRVRSGIAHVTGDTAENQNAAAATSSCSACRTVAVAVQIVLIQRSDASNISPRNIAIALNQSCFDCATFAAAYQYVVTTGSLVRFTPEGQQRLANLENELRGLAATDGVPFPELDARLAAVVAQMWAVVDSELIKVGARGPTTSYEDVDFEVGATTPSATLTASETPTPSETDSPDTDPTPEGTEPDRNSPSASRSESSSDTTSPEPSPSGP